MTLKLASAVYVKLRIGAIYAVTRSLIMQVYTPGPHPTERVVQWAYNAGE